MPERILPTPLQQRMHERALNGLCQAMRCRGSCHTTEMRGQQALQGIKGTGRCLNLPDACEAADSGVLRVA